MNHYLIAVGGCTMLLLATAGHAQQLPTAPDVQLPARSQAQFLQTTNYRTSSLGITLGWGSPYGWGVEYSYLVQPKLDINAGVGLGISGGKIGIGARYYLTPERKLSPFFGANLIRSGRLDKVELEVNNDRTEYSIQPNALLHLRSGLRWQPGHVGLLGTLGYGMRLSGDPISYNSNYPAPSPALQNWARAFGPGGVEISLGLIIGLGR